MPLSKLLFNSDTSSAQMAITVNPSIGTQADKIAVALNGNVVYSHFTTPADFFLSTDKGTTQQSYSTLYGVSNFPTNFLQTGWGLFSSSQDGTILYCWYYYGFYKSINSGQTWQLLTPTFVNNTGKRYSFMGPVSMCVASDGITLYALVKEYYNSPFRDREWYETSNLYKSTNGGVTFNLTGPEIGYLIGSPNIYCSPNSNTIMLYVGKQSPPYVTLLKSTDGGSTISNIYIDSMPFKITGNEDFSVMVAAYRVDWQGANTEFYKSTDAGSTWARIDSIPKMMTTEAVDYDLSSDGKTLFILEQNNITTYYNF